MINRYFGWYVYQGRLEEGVEAFSENLDYVFKKYNKPVLVTEFGADAIAGFHYDPPVMFSEEYQKELIKNYIETIESKDYTIGYHIWAFADFKKLRKESEGLYLIIRVFLLERDNLRWLQVI